MPALDADHPDAARTGHVDVAALVALHPVDYALVVISRPDMFSERAAAAQRAVRCDVERADMRARRVVLGKCRLIRRQTQSVRLAEVVRFAVPSAGWFPVTNTCAPAGTSEAVTRMVSGKDVTWVMKTPPGSVVQEGRTPLRNRGRVGQLVD